MEEGDRKEQLLDGGLNSTHITQERLQLTPLTDITVEFTPPLSEEVTIEMHGLESEENLRDKICAENKAQGDQFTEDNKLDEKATKKKKKLMDHKTEVWSHTN